MIQHPAILALLVAGFLSTFLLALAGWNGASILRHWDLSSGSERQLRLERRTYLVTSLLALVLPIQILSLFLFIFTADGLHTLFSGAMCAAGTLQANGFGYPTLLLKLVTCTLSGLWLVLHRADIAAPDYPLIRLNHALILLLGPLVLLEWGLEWSYFTGLRADVITSCCGSLFGQGRANLGATLAGLPLSLMRPLYWTSLLALLLSGGLLYFKKRGRLLFVGLSLIFTLIAVAALISFLCLYIYELPTHHCPFCLLQREYGFVGYLLYGSLLGVAVAGLAMGSLTPFQSKASLAKSLPRLERNLIGVALTCALMFALVTGIWMMVSPLRL